MFQRARRPRSGPPSALPVCPTPSRMRAAWAAWTAAAATRPGWSSRGGAGAAVAPTSGMA